MAKQIKEEKICNKYMVIRNKDLVITTLAAAFTKGLITRQKIVDSIARNAKIQLTPKKIAGFNRRKKKC